MKKILLVEEQSNFIEYYTEFLILKGYNLLVAKSEDNLFDRIYEFNPNLIMLDTDIPRYRIIDFIRQFENSDYQQIPILLLTRLFDNPEKSIFSNIKKRDFINRTGNPWEISEKVSMLIN